MSDFVAEKQKYLKMHPEEKRKMYLVKKYVELKDIKTWRDYFVSNKDNLEQKLLNNNSLAQLALTSPTPNNKFNELVSIWQGDITTLEIDAIVNAANRTLLGGGGVDGAIHKNAGPLLKSECATLNGCETGDAKITGGYRLPAKYVIHTVGPVGEKAQLLESSYKRSLEIALENNIRTIAFPCISTGVYGYPQRNAANVALNMVRKFLEENASKMDRIIFTLFLDEDVAIYETLMQIYFPLE